MSEPKHEEKRFLQILEEQIYSQISNYENEHSGKLLKSKNVDKSNKTLKTLQNIITQGDNNSPIEKEVTKYIEKTEKLPPKKIIELKEPLHSPQEPEKIVNQESSLTSIKMEEKEENLISNRIISDAAHHHKLLLIKYAICVNHGKSFLKIDQTNFEIVCEKCIEEGVKSQLEINVNLNNSDYVDEDGKIFNCFLHQNSKGSFYCEDCKEFVCNMCFADIHKEHKCHLPNVIKDEFTNDLTEEINNLNNLKPLLDDSVNDIKKISDNLKCQKDNIMKIPQNVLRTMGINNENQIELLSKKANEKLMGLDKEIADDAFTFNSIKEKNKKYFEILSKIINEINNKENSFDLCGYHKDKIELLNEINNHIKSSFNFVNIRLTDTNSKFNDNKDEIENSINLINKEISNYEKSCISSISTGRLNRVIVLQRYIHFVHGEIKYFKNTLIGFASNDNIFLTGLVLCGLHIKRKKNKSKNNNNISSETPTDNNNNNEATNGEENEIIKQIKIPILITVSKMVNQTEGEQLFSQKCELTGVRSGGEPCLHINFDKGISIIKEKLYLIKVENLSDDNYTDIWSGSVGKINRKEIQVLRCHNTGIQFLFKSVIGIQTDFDEFEQGIIGGVLYTPNK